MNAPDLPRFVRDLLASPPARGEGLNNWCYRVARVLHPYRAPDEIVALLTAASAGGGVKPGEIERAVANSKDAAWQPGPPAAGSSFPTAGGCKWPAPDPERIAAIVAQGPGAVELWMHSPVTTDDDDDGPGNTREVLQALFGRDNGGAADPLLCLGRSNREFATRPLSVWLRSPRLSALQFIVPSPMSVRTGKTKEGRQSEHTLENTGARRYVVCEFDSGATDTHAALLWHLSCLAPLALVVHSGGKSLHSWFFCAGQSEDALLRFMRYAVSLGADKATWTRSQFVRLPGGQRASGCRQSVFYFNPAATSNDGAMERLQP